MWCRDHIVIQYIYQSSEKAIGADTDLKSWISTTPGLTFPPIHTSYDEGRATDLAWKRFIFKHATITDLI